ncbi:MAG: DUF616 domain-containing protein [Prosthecobacter sp.]|nr:DUF616 domain-containing protein [Prosthecobacter sp.]
MATSRSTRRPTRPGAWTTSSTTTATTRASPRASAALLALPSHQKRVNILQESEALIPRFPKEVERIRRQMAAYTSQGFDLANEAAQPITLPSSHTHSHLPDARLILRAHHPLNALHSTLWWEQLANLDYFSRDQLSFGYVTARFPSSLPLSFFPFQLLGQLFDTRPGLVESSSPSVHLSLMINSTLPFHPSKVLSATFIQYGQYASRTLRGDMVGHFLGKIAASHFVSFNTFLLSASDGADVSLSMLPRQPGTFCILVKGNQLSSRSVRRLVESCHRGRGLFIWDLLDHHRFFEDPAPFLRAQPDYWMITSSGAREFLTSHGVSPRRLISLPHHHTNFLTGISPRKSFRSHPIVCSHDSPRNRMDVADEHYLRSHLAAMGHQFVHIPSSDHFVQNQSSETMWGQNELHATLQACGLSIIWPSQSETNTPFMPNTRLVNWWSHGVPTLMPSHHQAYRDVCQSSANPRFCMELSASSLFQVVTLLNRLVSDDAYYHLVSQFILNESKRYHPQSLSEQLFYYLSNISSFNEI